MERGQVKRKSGPSGTDGEPETVPTGEQELDRSSADIQADQTWKPRTLAEYVELAGACASILSANENSPLLSRVYVRCLSAFEIAVGLMLWSQGIPENDVRNNLRGAFKSVDGVNPLVEVPKAWLLFGLILVKLSSDFSSFGLSFGERANVNSFYDKFHWPRNPRSVAFTSSGWSALEVAAGFAHFVAAIVLCTMPEATGGSAYSATEVQVEPRPLESVCRWHEVLREQIKDMTSASDWSYEAIKREHNTIVSQIDYEYEQARRLQAEPVKEHRETGIVAANNCFGLELDLTDTEANILEALGADTLTGPALLKKTGYDYSSHYRTILSNLVKRRVLRKTGQGYQRSQTV